MSDVENQWNVGGGVSHHSRNERVPVTHSLIEEKSSSQ